MAAGGTQSQLELKASLGQVLDCSMPPPAELDDVAGLGDEARLDAALIRRMLIEGKLGSPPAVHNGRARRSLLSTRRPATHPAEAESSITVDPQGIQIRGARIYGELNLDGLPSDTKIGLRLTKCLLEHPVTLCDGGLPWLELDTCVLPAIVADRAQIGMMTVTGCRFVGACPRERLSLNRAHVAGDLLLDRTCVLALPPSGAAPGQATIDLQGVKIDGRLSLEKTIVGCHPTRSFRPALTPGEVPSDIGVDAAGAAVCLSGATVAGPLVFRGASLNSASGPALLADHLTVTGDAFLDTSGDRHFSATGAGKGGAVCLIGATIAGQLSLEGARLTNTTGPALLADLLSVKGPTLLEDGFHANGSVSFWGATLTGRLSMKDSTIETTAVAEENEPGAAAAVWLSGATLTSSLVVRGATLTSEHGPALMADYLTVKNDAFLCEDEHSNFNATGACALGTVCLAGASITGQLSLCGSTLTNRLVPDDHHAPDHRHAPALLVDEANIQGDVLIDKTFTASTETEVAAVSMVNTTIGKQLCCSLQGIGGRPRLDLRELTVTTFTLNLGGLNLKEKSPSNRPLLRLDGLKYTQMPTLTHAGDPSGELPPDEKRNRWIGLLKQAEWAPQPYQGLAAAYESLGDDSSSRKVLIASRTDGLHRAKLGWLAKVYEWLLRIVIGYGYRSTRAIYCLIAVFAVTLILAMTWFSSSHFIGLSPAAATARPGSPPGKTVVPTTVPVPLLPCTFPGSWNYAISLAFPVIILTGTDDPQCGVPSHGANEFVVAYGWLVRIAAVTLYGFYGAGLAGLTRTPPSS